MADWDDEDFDPDAGFAKSSATDKWEGEDEDEDAPDDWAASDDEEKKEGEGNGTEAGSTEAFQVKKKKNKLEQALKSKAEKRKKKLEEEKQKKVELTPEEELAEKLRRQKLVEDSDLEIAKEAFGITEDRTTIDGMNPTSEEEFSEFAKLLKDKLSNLESSEHYYGLLEDVFQSCCVCLEADQVKKLGSSLTAIGNEKSKAQRATKGKKTKKKAALAGSGKSAKNADFEDMDLGNEFDDFM